jgi:hypothetical protein
MPNISVMAVFIADPPVPQLLATSTPGNFNSWQLHGRVMPSSTRMPARYSASWFGTGPERFAPFGVSSPPWISRWSASGSSISRPS